MTAIDDRPTLPERYARAIESTHLEVVADERQPVDMLIAAGWCAESLGTALYRLRAEFDQVRSSMRHEARELATLSAERDNLLHAVELERRKADVGPMPAGFLQALDELQAQAGRATKNIERAALTARALAMVHLKSLAGTKDALFRFAEILATRRRFMQPNAVVLVIAGRVLDAWLDPLCPACEGRGFNGGFGIPVALCTTCSGTHLRVVRLARDEASHEFGRALLTQMDRMTDHVTGQMRRFLSGGQR